MEGHCLCGAIQVHIPCPTEIPPILTYACHCRDCQRSAGGPYQILSIYSAEDVKTEDLNNHIGW
jgi:hypothetical protein